MRAPPMRTFTGAPVFTLPLASPTDRAPGPVARTDSTR